MFEKFSRSQNFFLLSLIVALCFNNWILGYLFNYKLLSVSGSISELSASGQPHAWVFRSLDVVSGIFIASLGLWWRKTQNMHLKGSAVIFWGLLILGIANAADALMPLGCSETLNSACSVPISISLHHFVLPDHAYSSTAIGIGYFLLPLGGWIYSKAQKMRTLLLVSRTVFALNLLVFASILHEYASVGVTVKASGWLQEAQMLSIGAWIVFLGHSYKKLVSVTR